MTKASHNTFSYAEPLQWWLRPWAFVARCQSRTLTEQVEAGLRIFDLRIRQDKNGEWIIAHNAFIYMRGLDTIKRKLDWLDGKAQEGGYIIRVRVLHEVRNERQARQSSSVAFNSLCAWMCYKYHHIMFFGGQRVMDWRSDYVFPAVGDIYYIERHASARWPKVLHWWPWLYARLHNKEIEKEYREKEDVVFMDFCGDSRK